VDLIATGGVFPAAALVAHLGGRTPQAPAAAQLVPRLPGAQDFDGERLDHVCGVLAPGRSLALDGVFGGSPHARSPTGGGSRFPGLLRKPIAAVGRRPSLAPAQVEPTRLPAQYAGPSSANDGSVLLPLLLGPLSVTEGAVRSHNRDN